MFTSVKWFAEPITQPCRLIRSQFKVTDLSLEFCVSSVSPLPLGGFSLNFGQMVISVGQCAEPITQPCGHGQGNSWRSRVWALYLVSVSLLPLKGFSLNVDQMFASVRWCAEPITQVQGHNWRSPVWAFLILGLLHCHSDCLVKFGSSVRLSEMMCRTYNSTMQTQGQGHNWSSSVSILFASYLLNPLKDFHETLVKCLP